MDDLADDDWNDIVAPEMLTRRVTLEEYFAERESWVRMGQIRRSAIDQDRLELEARWQAGDEWREWLMGTQPLRQIGGLALVRGGRIAWARHDWFS